jgi:hypothetical protein
VIVCSILFVLNFKSKAHCFTWFLSNQSLIVPNLVSVYIILFSRPPGSYSVKISAICDVGEGSPVYLSVSTLDDGSSNASSVSTTDSGAVVGAVVGSFLALAIIIILV